MNDDDDDEEALIAAIEASPEDLPLRLVYADWLEERGDPRAELVRIDGELWRTPIDLSRVRNLYPRRLELRRGCDPRWIVRVSRPSFAEIRRRLGILASLDPRAATNELIRCRYRLNEPLPLAQVEAIEARIGCRIPEEYRRFVTELGDGTSQPERRSNGLQPLEPNATPRLAEPFPAGGVPPGTLDPPGALAIDTAWFLIVTGPEVGTIWTRGNYRPEQLAGAPSGTRIGFIDWYVQRIDGWLNESVSDLSDGDDVLARDPREVREINFAKRGLAAVPGGLRRMTELGTLDLSLNPIEELPAWIGELSKLELLLLYRTKLRRLPESIGDLSALTELDCTGTPTLEQLPDSIGRLSRLDRLELARCGLAALPDAIGDLPLTRLSLSRNRLVRLPGAMGRMKLEALELMDNRLTDLPEEFAGLDELTTLELTGNPMQALPDCIERLPRLAELRLDRMPDLDLADACRKLARVETLRSLSLYCCQLDSLPDEIGLLAQLHVLNLQMNPLSTAPGSLARLTGLRSLSRDDDEPAFEARLRELLPHLFEDE